MATKEQPQPENNVAQPEAAVPVPPAASYQAYPQYVAYADPNKGKSKLLTFEYAFAMGSAVAAAYAMILGIDALLDMGRTCINVTGDVVGTLIVSRQEEKYQTSNQADA